MIGIQDLLEGLRRIWTEDRLAIYFALVLLLLQFAILFAGFRRALHALRRAASAIRESSAAVSHWGVSAATVERTPLPEARRALETVLGLVGRGEELDREELAEVFAPSRLLPSAYNARWDAAAPGVFMAIGILGTFLGLILGFLRVDPGAALDSVGPLLGGMVVAFANSFVGVLSSVIWTSASRHRRHQFDSACNELLRSVAATLPHTSLGQRSVSHLKRVEEGIASLASAISQLAQNTQESSDRLLANLSKNVGESFESLINKPFEQVNASISRFNQLVASAAEVHEGLIERLESTARRIDEGGEKLSRMFEASHECVEEFATATLQLREASSAASEVIERTQDAAGQLQSAADAVGVSAVRVVQVSQVMDGLATAMTSSTAEMTEGAKTFERSSERLERCSADLRTSAASIGEDTRRVAQEASQIVAAELERAISAMSHSLSESSTKTISAFEASANAVVESVAENMTDLTERLSANLGTLGSQISENSDSMNHVIGDIRRQVEFAARTNRESLDQLAKTTPEVIKAQLAEFDRALATAVDHFSGTLAQWDGKLTAIEDLSAEFRRLPTGKDGSKIQREADHDRGTVAAGGIAS